MKLHLHQLLITTNNEDTAMSSRTTLPAWSRLNILAKQQQEKHLNELFAADPARFEKFSLQLSDVFFDYSKQRVDDEVMQALVSLAEQCNLVEWRNKMFAGEHINITEDRAVLHVALRDRKQRSIIVDGVDVSTEVSRELKRIEAFVGAVRSGEWKGFSGEMITDVVSIGIGGSHLGPQMVTEATAAYADHSINVHYVSNVDGSQIATILDSLDPATTLFVIASKTFTTSETMTNAATALKWLSEAAQAAGYSDTKAAAGKHFVAVSSNVAAAREMGIEADNIFCMWDWVGGRFSLWSAIGLPIALYLGFDKFVELLEGAHEVDEHFASTDLACNIPVLMALLSIWNTTFMGFSAQAILPYDQAMHMLPAYLQQAEMESNGKFVVREGGSVDYQTVPLIWGEVGINGQHAFYQFLHQSPAIIPADFIGSVHSSIEVDGHHDVLMSNYFAQSKALMSGVSAAEIRADLAAKGLPAERIEEIVPHKVHPGNRPTSSFLLSKVEPKTLGMMIALYEHKIFAQGVILDICSFDQWGVELGKVIAKQIEADLRTESSDAAALQQKYDVSTAGLMTRYKSQRGS
jgi:glucose-6-phosphate isomerase